MKKIQKFAYGATMVSVCALASPAMAQNWDASTALSGNQSNTTMASPDWSAVRIDGINCNSGTPTGLTNQYTLGSVGGMHGAVAGQPLVVKNFGQDLYNNGVTFQANGTYMHPGPNNECAVLRLTIPAGGKGIYKINAAFLSADSNISAGDGVNGMVLHNGQLLGTLIDTKKREPGRIQEVATLCPGDTVDFAVNMKGIYLFDTTGLTAAVNFQDAAPQRACVKRGTGTVSHHEGGVLTPIGPIVSLPNDPVKGVSPCCGPWAEDKIIPSLAVTFPTSAAGPYSLTYNNQASMDTQMAAYLNYVHAMDPSITTISLEWQAIDLGAGSTGSSPATAGPIVAGAQNVTWTWTTGGVTNSGGSFWAGTSFLANHWYGFVTTTLHNGTADSPYFGETCINNSATFNWIANSVNRVGGNDSGSGIIATTNASGKIVNSADIQVQPGKKIMLSPFIKASRR